MKNLKKHNYTILDGIFSLFIVIALFFGYIVLTNLYLDKYPNDYDITDRYVLLTQTVFCLLFLAAIAGYMALRKQKASSIGITLERSKQSLRIGLVYSLMYLVVFIIIHLIKHDFRIEKNGTDIIFHGIYFLIYVALFEEILFRGFINSRMQGLFRNRYVTTILVSVLFSLMHMPFNAIGFSGTGSEYFSLKIGYHLILCFLHFVFQYLYDRENHIAAPLLFHFVYDYVQWIFIGIL